MPSFPIFGGRKAWLDRLFCCVVPAAPDGGPVAPAPIVENGLQGQPFDILYPEGFTGDNGPIVVTMPDAPEWLELTDNGDGTFSIAGVYPMVPGPLTYEIFGTDASGSTSLPITFNLVAVPLAIITPGTEPWTATGEEGAPLAANYGEFTLTVGADRPTLTFDFGEGELPVGTTVTDFLNGYFGFVGEFPEYGGAGGTLEYTVTATYPGAINSPVVIPGNFIVSTAPPG